MRRLFVLILLALCLAPEANAERARMTAEEAYALGLRYLKRGYYVKALEQFNRVRTYYRDDPYALKAELAIADVHFKKDEWDAARVSYEDFLHAHPRYKDLDYVVYRLGLTLMKKAPVIAARDQTWTRQAVNIWVGFSARFPESEYREEVDQEIAKSKDRLARKELIIARFYGRRDAHVSVVGRIEDMLRLYPSSSDRVEALGLLGEAYASSGRLDLAGGAMTKLEEEAPKSTAARRLRRTIDDSAVN